MKGGSTFPMPLKIVIVLLLIAAATGFCLSPWGQAVDRFVYDFYFLLRGDLETPREIVVAAIDEASFEAVGRQWPWPRSLHARLLDELRRAGARVVALDIIFAEPSTPREDNLFAAAIARYPGVVLACDISVVDDQSYAQESIISPLPLLPGKDTAVGYTNLPLDPDGFVRRFELARSGLDAFPLLAARKYQGAAGSASGEAPGSQSVTPPATPREEAMNINYYGPARTIRTVSYYQALDPERYLPGDFFRDKIVFVGLSINTGFDSKTRKADHYPVPFTRWGKSAMAGVEILANIAANILHRNAVRLCPPGWYLPWSLLISLLAGLVFIRLKPLRGVLVLAAITAVILGAAFLLFFNGSFYIPVIFFLLPLIACYLTSPFFHYWEAWQERNFIRKTFATYLSPPVVNRLLANPELLKLGGKTTEATVMFLDLAGFTSFSERITPEELIDLLNRNLSELSEVIFKWEGMVDKYIGDAIMAVWGTPVHQDDHALRACRAACEMRKVMAVLSERERQTTGIDLKARIGINTGFVVAGNVGGKRHFNYTVLGNEVNLASRLEGVNKVYHTDIIIGENTAALVREAFELREIDVIRVVGKTEPVKIYELLCPKGEIDARTAQLRAHFQEGIEKYRQRRWEEARICFAAGLEVDDDEPCRIFVDRCREAEEQPPPYDWDGVYRVKTK